MAVSRRDTSLVLAVGDTSQVGSARRAVRDLATELGLGDLAVERAAIVTTEAARNVALHGGGGELVVRALGAPGAPGVEVLALDRGPGISDLGAAMRDGYSTAGTPGHGLGSMVRLGAAFDLWTHPGRGTAMVVEVRDGDPAPGDGLRVGTVCATMPRETACGDGWAAVRARTHDAFLVVDGLGHGGGAAEAAEVARRTFLANAALPAAALVESLHAALRATRGAALAVARVDREEVHYAGIGNVSASLMGAGGTRRLVSLSGTAGHEIRRVQEFTYEWPADGVLVMHSDGVSAHWGLAEYPGIERRHPALLAGVLYRDHGRRRDDATVLVARRHD